MASALPHVPLRSMRVQFGAVLTAEHRRLADATARGCPRGRIRAIVQIQEARDAAYTRAMKDQMTGRRTTVPAQAGGKN